MAVRRKDWKALAKAYQAEADLSLDKERYAVAALEVAAETARIYKSDLHAAMRDTAKAKAAYEAVSRTEDALIKERNDLLRSLDRELKKNAVQAESINFLHRRSAKREVDIDRFNVRIGELEREVAKYKEAPTYEHQRVRDCQDVLATFRSLLK